MSSNPLKDTLAKAVSSNVSLKTVTPETDEERKKRLEEIAKQSRVEGK